MRSGAVRAGAVPGRGRWRCAPPTAALRSPVGHPGLLGYRAHRERAFLPSTAFLRSLIIQAALSGSSFAMTVCLRPLFHTYRRPRSLGGTNLRSIDPPPPLYCRPKIISPDAPCKIRVDVDVDWACSKMFRYRTSEIVKRPVGFGRDQPVLGLPPYLFYRTELGTGPPEGTGSGHRDSVPGICGPFWSCAARRCP